MEPFWIVFWILHEVQQQEGQVKHWGLYRKHKEQERKHYAVVETRFLERHPEIFNTMYIVILPQKRCGKKVH